MERIPTLVQEFKLAATTNSVCVAIVKFTLGQFALYFTAAAPAPVKLARQITSLRAAYDVMNDAYAEQQKRVRRITHAYPGGTTIVLFDTTKKIAKGAPKEWGVNPSESLLRALKAEFGEENVVLK